MVKKRILTILLCVVIVSVACCLQPAFQAQASDTWLARGDGVEYTLTQETDGVSISTFSDPLPGTLRGACYYDRYLYALTQQNGTLFFSACFCLTHTIRTVSLTDAFQAPQPGDAFDFVVHADNVFTYTAAGGETVAFRYFSGQVTPAETWSEEVLGAAAVPENQGPPEGFASSAVEPQNPDRGYFYFPEPVSVAGAKVRYFRESGGQVAGAELAVYTSEGVQMQTGAVATGCYLVEKRDGEVYAYCVAIVMGDLLGSGAPDEASYERLHAYLLSEDDSLLSPLARLAADMNGDGTLSVADLLLLRRAIA